MGYGVWGINASGFGWAGQGRAGLGSRRIKLIRTD